MLLYYPMIENFKEFCKTNKKLVKITAWIAFCALVFWAVLLGFVIKSSSHFAPQNADAIVVLGHAVDEQGNPGPWLTERLQKAIQLYDSGYAPYIILTGGTGPMDTVAVSHIMADYVLAAGIPVASILIEDNSNNTYENFNMTYNIATELNIQSIIVVTNGFHMYRSLILGGIYFENLYPAPSPTPWGGMALLAYMREPLSVVANVFVYIVIAGLT